jgi:phage baseplate assembly protein W
MTAAKDFLGRGWKFLVRPDERGALRYVEFDEDIREAIRIILGTSPGERVMRPDFGCGISRYVFASMDATTVTSIENAVREALTRFEPRIDVQDVKADQSRVADGVLSINIAYVVRSTNARENMVYPFYLTEGG